MILLENIKLQKISAVLVYTLYKGQKYTTQVKDRNNVILKYTVQSNVHLDASLHPQMDLVIQLMTDLVTIESVLNSYIARAINISTTSKDVDLLLPWANLNILTLPKIPQERVTVFLENNKKYSHLAKERMLMNLLMK